MKNKIYISILFLASCLLSLVISSVAYAGFSCQPIYGGGQACVANENVLINKKILNPSNNTFVDNLGVNDPKYSPGFITNFRLEVTNSSNTNIARVEVKDIFPKYIEFAAGPGNFDQQTKTLTFTLDNLAPNETRTFGIVGRVVGMEQLPVNQGVVCVVNQAIATTNGDTVSQDNSQFCIERKATASTPATKGGFPILFPSPVITTPSTGPQSLVLFSMIPLGTTGWLLRKYSIKKEAKN